MAMVKSGWLHRQSTILRRWKRNWFDLWADGRLVFFNDQQRCDMEDELHMRVDCINIRGSAACPELNPPEAKMRNALFQIVCRDGRVVSLCAESADDALAWTMALQDARINAVSLSSVMSFVFSLSFHVGCFVVVVPGGCHTSGQLCTGGEAVRSSPLLRLRPPASAGLCYGGVRRLRGRPPGARRPDRVLARRAALRRGLPLPVPRCVRRPGAEQRRHAGAAVGGRGRRGPGDARRSRHRSGHRIPLRCLLVMPPPPPP